MRILVLQTDAYGGRGGIAHFNRELLAALCAHPSITGVTALVRSVPDDPGVLPAKLRYPLRNGASKVRFTIEAISETIRHRFDAVICGHLNLLPIAAVVARAQDLPLVLVIHGIDAWTPHHNPLVRRAASRTNATVSVSHHTKSLFTAWAGIPTNRVRVVPNCVDTDAFTPGPKNVQLLRSLGLNEAPTLLTVARLSSNERYKGVDEILDLLPHARKEIQGLQYLIVGDGDDRERLQAKAAALGVGPAVAFTGYISEREKLECYRSADAFVMLSRGEGFGIVYLEALACGLPVIASSLDASREALLDGALGQVVDPDSPGEVLLAIHSALHTGRGAQHPGLERFSRESFRHQWFRVLEEELGLSPAEQASSNDASLLKHSHKSMPMQAS